MKLLIILFMVAVKESICQQCYVGKKDNPVLEDCSPPTNFCHWPTFKDYSGYVQGSENVDFECGNCPSSAGSACSGCSGKACNSPPEDFKCKNWQYQALEWNLQATSITCTLQKGSTNKIMCNWPGNNDPKKMAVQNGGCGPCDKIEKSQGTCVECDKEECNFKDFVDDNANGNANNGNANNGNANSGNDPKNDKECKGGNCLSSAISVKTIALPVVVAVLSFL